MSEQVVPNDAFFEYFLGFDQEQIDLIKEMQQKQQAEEPRVTPEEEEMLTKEEGLGGKPSVEQQPPGKRIVTQGGEGSGHFDHEGRPGEVGGSAPDGEGTSMSEEDKWEALKQTKVIDKEGNPLVVWHGTPTNEPFEEFDPNRNPVHRKQENIGGIYFHSDVRYANNYRGGSMKSGQLIKAHLIIKNPLDITDSIIKYRKKGFSFSEAKAKSLGQLDKSVHDGVIFRGNASNPAEYVVFSPKQIIVLKKKNNV